jgi:hypothetical protein
MSEHITQRWVAFRDSPQWRRVSGSPPVVQLRRHPVAQHLGLARRSVETSLRHRADPTRFDSVHAFCLFVGHTKSGGSLLGALLDAHPEIVFSDEVGPLAYLDAGFRREQLFHLMAKAARREAMKGRVTARRLEPYSLAVPGQQQGACSGTRVIGDSRAGPTTRLLAERPELLTQLRSALGSVEDRYIQVVRHPVDPISAMVIRGRRTIDGAVDDHAAQCRRLVGLRELIGSDRLLTVHYEDLIAAPRETVASVCRFLGVGADQGYLTACSQLVTGSRPGERRWVDWTSPAEARVAELVEGFSFLERYRESIGSTPSGRTT